MLFDRYAEIEVTCGATSYPGITLTAEAYVGAVLNPGWNFHQEATLALLSTCAPALEAGFGDNSALTVTLGTGSNIGEAAKDTLLDSAHLTGAITVGTLAGLTVWLAAGALAHRAVLSA